MNSDEEPPRSVKDSTKQAILDTFERQNGKIHTEYVYYVRLPSPNVHVGHPVGNDVSLSCDQVMYKE